MKNISLRILVILLFLAFGFVNAQKLIPLNRYYSYSIDRHFYTTNVNEVPPGSVPEGVLCYVYDSPLDESTVPIFLLLKSQNGDRLLTSSVEEKNNAISAYGYKYIGIIGYSNQFSSRRDIFRYFNSSKSDRFYTNSRSELGGAAWDVIKGYVYEQTVRW